MLEGDPELESVCVSRGEEEQEREQEQEEEEEEEEEEENDDDERSNLLCRSRVRREATASFGIHKRHTVHDKEGFGSASAISSSGDLGAGSDTDAGSGTGTIVAGRSAHWSTSGVSGGRNTMNSKSRSVRSSRSDRAEMSLDEGKGHVTMLLERLDVLLKRLPRELPAELVRSFQEQAMLRISNVSGFSDGCSSSSSNELIVSIQEAPEIDDGPMTLRSIVRETWERAAWLVSLLLLQSFSSFILQRYSKLIEMHLMVTFFLTMLVGAGGNAGNQSAVMIIRGLATGTVRPDNQGKILWRQFVTGVIMAFVLVAFGFGRVVVFGGDSISAIAICISLFIIVVVSVVLGTLLPLGLHWIGVDSAHAGPTIQVVMDILGVFITCWICAAVFQAEDATALAATVPVPAPAHAPMPLSHQHSFLPSIGGSGAATSLHSVEQPTQNLGAKRIAHHIARALNQTLRQTRLSSVDTFR